MGPAEVLLLAPPPTVRPVAAPGSSRHAAAAQPTDRLTTLYDCQLLCLPPALLSRSSARPQCCKRAGNTVLLPGLSGRHTSLVIASSCCIPLTLRTITVKIEGSCGAVAGTDPVAS